MLRLLWLVAVIVLVLWLLSLVFDLISGPFLHVLLVIGIIFLIIWLVQRGTFRR
jgi:membrane-bound ClpP family serine protease